MEKPEPVPPSPLEAALHAHINTVADRPCDARMLLELERTCRLARELLSIGKAPDALRKEHLLPGGGMDPQSLYESGIGSGQYSSPNYGGIAIQVPNNPTETFGVQAIKELIALVPGLMKKNDPPTPAEPQMSYADMASAMAVAKGSGDHVLYEKLFRLLELEQERVELCNALLRPGDAEPPVKPTLVETHAEEKTEAA